MDLNLQVMDLSSEDEAVVATAKRDGIAVLSTLLTASELEPIRTEFDQLHLDMGKGPGTPGVRDSISGDAVLAYPHLVALYSHPRIIAVAQAILQEPVPWARQIKTNRYTPEHVGVRRPTGKVDIDNGFLRGADSRLGFGSQHVSQPEPTDSKGTQLQKPTPRNAITKRARI